MNGATYGLEMQNLVYENTFRTSLSSFRFSPTRIQRLSHLFVNVIFKYGWQKLNRIMTDNGWAIKLGFKKFLYKWTQRLDVAFKSISLVNFLTFLYNGRYDLFNSSYRSLLDRCLGMRIVYKHREMARALNYEFMNQTLVWGAFTDFLFAIRPFINTTKLKATFKRFLSRNTQSTLPLHICLICESKGNPKNKVQIPYATNCGHIFCYYCIQSSLMLDSAFACPRCNTTVDRISPQQSSLAPRQLIIT